jgi:hypothetical protein
MQLASHGQSKKAAKILELPQEILANLARVICGVGKVCPNVDTAGDIIFTRGNSQIIQKYTRGIRERSKRADKVFVVNIHSGKVL